jgi:hypothetical protein
MLDALKSALAARLAQFLLRLATMIAAAIGWEGFDQGAQGKAFVAGVMAVVAFLLDALIHSKKFAPLIAKGREFLQFSDEQPPADKSSTLASWIVLALLGVGLAVAATVPGCSSNPSPQVQAAQRSEAFRVALHALNVAIKRGDVSPEQSRKLAPYALAADALIDQLQARAGTVETLQAQLKIAPDDQARLEIQAQLDVARDAYTNLLRDLDAAITAFERAKDSPDAIPDAPAAGPIGRGRGDAHPAATLALARHRSGDHLARAA